MLSKSIKRINKNDDSIVFTYNYFMALKLRHALRLARVCPLPLPTIPSLPALAPHSLTRLFWSVDVLYWLFTFGASADLRDGWCCAITRAS